MSVEHFRYLTELAVSEDCSCVSDCGSHYGTCDGNNFCHSAFHLVERSFWVLRMVDPTQMRQPADVGLPAMRFTGQPNRTYTIFWVTGSDVANTMAFGRLGVDHLIDPPFYLG